MLQPLDAHQNWFVSKLTTIRLCVLITLGSLDPYNHTLIMDVYLIDNFITKIYSTRKTST
jgi:hypothetical protein